MPKQKCWPCRNSESKLLFSCLSSESIRNICWIHLEPKRLRFGFMQWIHDLPTPQKKSPQTLPIHLQKILKKIFLLQTKGLVFFFPVKDGAFLHLALKIPMVGFWSCFVFGTGKNKHKFFEKNFRGAPCRASLKRKRLCVVYLRGTNFFMMFSLCSTSRKIFQFQNILDRFTLAHDKEMTHGFLFRAYLKVTKYFEIKI